MNIKGNRQFPIEPKFKSVGEREFINFIATYPRPLVENFVTICDPPAISFIDPAIGECAITWGYSDDTGDYYYCPREERDYRIMENHEEVYESKIKAILKERTTYLRRYGSNRNLAKEGIEKELEEALNNTAIIEAPFEIARQRR